MHHKNHNHSSANHNNPAHHKEQYPSTPAPEKRHSNFLNKVAERFKGKPASEEEIHQLRLNTQREELKTRMRKAKVSRPSRFAFLDNKPTSGTSYRRSSKQYQQNDSSWLLGNNHKNDSSWNPGFSMFSDTERRGKKNQKSGLEELF